MFRVEDPNGVRRVSVARRPDEATYLFKADESKFPLLSQLDDYDPTAFGYEEMPQLLSELAAAQSETELTAAWNREKADTEGSIQRLQADLKRYAHTMWSIEAETRLVHIKQHLESLNRPDAFDLFLQEAHAHLQELQKAATLCHDTEGVLLHITFE